MYEKCMGTRYYNIERGIKMIDITSLSLTEINKLRESLCLRPSEFVPFTRILSRDCRSDSTKEYFGIYDESGDVVKLFKRQKTQFSYQTTIPISIYIDGMCRTGTSTYELQPDSKAIADYILKWRKRRIRWE